MLTDQEKFQIRLEHRYRRRFFTKPPAPKGFLGFLNTSLGIFILSTVFISLFSWSYNQLTERQRARVKRAETENRLRLEIAHRLRIIRKLTTRFSFVDLNIIRTATYGFRVGSMQVPSHMLIYSPIFDEYGARSLESLLLELESLVPEPEKSRIRTGRLNIFLISEYFDKLVQTAQEAPQALNGEGKIYFCELPAAEKSNLEQQVFVSLALLEN